MAAKVSENTDGIGSDSCSGVDSEKTTPSWMRAATVTYCQCERSHALRTPGQAPTSAPGDRFCPCLALHRKNMALKLTQWKNMSRLHVLFRVCFSSNDTIFSLFLRFCDHRSELREMSECGKIMIFMIGRNCAQTQPVGKGWW